MKIEEIIEGNKLIAEFMGGKKRYYLIYRDGKRHLGANISDSPFPNIPFNDHIHQSGKNMTKYSCIQNYAWQFYEKQDSPIYDNWLKYHSDWSSLMPVVEKIEGFKTAAGYIRFKIQIDKNNCLIYSNDFDNRGIVGETKIDATWLAVIDFIKFYNQTK